MSNQQINSQDLYKYHRNLKYNLKYLNILRQMTEETKEISIQDLQRSLEVYQIESEQKLEHLRKLFLEKGSLDIAKMFYEERSSIEIKFQNTIDDLVEFLVEQQVPVTEKLRKIFLRILQNPLLLLFKVSKFQILNLRHEGFDIEIEPIDAILELSKSIQQNIDEYLSITSKKYQQYAGKQYQSWQSFLEQATINKIQLKVFMFYSYLRKGASLLKKKFEYKMQIVDVFNKIESKLLPVLLQKQDSKTVKQLSVLNHQIFQLESAFDVLYFYIHIPFTEKYRECFQEFQAIATKVKQTSNYNVFILHFIKHDKQILQKLSREKIDPIYKNYIQNALTTILQFWGCRVCYYRQFCDLFIALFRQHPDRIKALELTLEFNPAMTKDDIVLLRTNFKIDIEKKNGQLLSLLKLMGMEEINDFLSNFYHATLYNMEFKSLEREKIISLLTLMNNNSSLSQFFSVAERAFKEWNHTIDFNHAHKFIETEFAYPKINEDQVKQCFSLLTNLCALEEKGFHKEYQTLIRAGSIGKSLLQFVKYLQRDQKCRQILSWPLTNKFLIEAFNFLRKALNPATETESLASAFSTVLDKIQEQNQRNKLQQSLIASIQENPESFHIKECLDCLKRYRNNNLTNFVNIFMAGTSQNNEIVKKFGYLNHTVEQLKTKQISQEDAQFISSRYRINNGRLDFKDAAIFNLSDLEVLTIPSQIDKVIDNYYFTLDSNSKKFIEYLVQVWNEKRQQKSAQFTFYSQMVNSLIETYPISIPLLCSVRLNGEKGSIRFIEFLCNQVSQDEVYSNLVQRIIQCNCIRYKNGKDYIQEEVIPMALKQTIQNINSTSPDKICSQKLFVLAKLFERANLNEIKLQTIQKSIEKVRFLLLNCKNSKQAEKYGQSFRILMRNFFSKKSLQMKKQKLSEGYNNLIWNDARNYASNTQNKSQIKDTQIVQYIAVTPFTITQQFNIDEYKIKKIVKKEQKPSNLVQLNEVLSKLPISQGDNLKYSFSASLIPENRKKVLVNNSKYDLVTYLGKQSIEELEDKQNVDLVFNLESKQEKRQRRNQKKEEDTNNFILYYMKSLAMPSIDHKIILEHVTVILESDNPSISFLWTNSKNLQNYFIDFLSIFQFASLESDKRLPQKDPAIKRIVQLVNADSLSVRKKILNIFASLGYSNIWAQNFDMFWSNFPIRKFLGFNAKTEQSFFSTVLRNTLKKQQLRTQLVQFLGKLFSTRSDQNALMLKVVLNRDLINDIMFSLSIPHLQKISLMFHSNFHNQRIFTDQLHQGLKALNVCSQNRTYIEYIKISKEVEDEEFTNCIKLFKQNYKFFIRIQKEGYKFKKSEETNLLLTRLSNIIRNAKEGENISAKANQFMEQYIKQIYAQQLATANRVKSFYYVTKLRDLSYQNSIMISILHEVMRNTGKSQEQILDQINKLEIFSLMNKLYNDLVRYEDDWRNIEKYTSKQKIDGYVLENQLAICSTSRFSHSMSKVYEKSQVQYDQILQRCIEALKGFFITPIGSKWLQTIDIYPAFLIKSFIDSGKANKLTNQINQKLKEYSTTFEFVVQDNQLIQGLLKGFRSAPRSSYVSKGITINYNNSKRSPIDMLKPLQQRLSTNQTFVTLKSSGNIIFNKYKSSEATLEEIQVLGYIISYSLLNKIPLQLNLHPSIISALSFNIAELDYLLDVDFKLWQEIRNVLTMENCSTLGLNLSHNFESLQNFKPVRIQLVDKGSSTKVNNLNRDVYADLLACYVLYEEVKPQISRLLSTILSIVPKELISCSSTKQIVNLFYDKEKSKKIIDQFMKKLGVVLPQTLIDEKGKRIENLKDFQNVQWLQDLILENEQLRNKYWKDQSNIFIVTTLSTQGSIRIINGRFLIEHFSSKQDMKKFLAKM